MLYIDAMPFRGTVCHVLQSPPFSQLSIARLIFFITTHAMHTPSYAGIPWRSKTNTILNCLCTVIKFQMSQPIGSRSSPWSWSGSSGARSTTTSNSHHVESAHVGKIFPFLSSLLM
ncbi:hypothetical protein SETIT_7G068700v2 [Setaria italica]|uniref:Uncharacterized protein n=1 Tax=Setaria italica TaxID=4555 RepID=A0A368RT41_SETIT|nr:hypothetical protein SETIT_7G068700v2 [Setaria italica]